MTGGPRSKLTVEGLGKQYGSEREADGDWAVRGIDLEVAAGEVLTIIGASGCGKTTVLNCIAGLIPFEEGSIEIDGQSVTGPGADRAVVFQQASLLPWRTTRGNAVYGMELQRRLSKDEMRERVSRALDLVGLAEVADHYPHQLSGGMQQRANLARALATSAEVLLMDEPFGALDALTKSQMQEELMRIAAELDQTIVFITHDIEEAVYLGDRVAVMSGSPGGIERVESVPLERPREPSVKRDAAFRELEQRLWETLTAGAAA